MSGVSLFPEGADFGAGESMRSEWLSLKNLSLLGGEGQRTRGDSRVVKSSLSESPEFVLLVMLRNVRSKPSSFW